MKTPRSLLQAFINREHTLEVPAERLTRIIGRHGFRHPNLVTDPIEAVSIEISPGRLMVSGRFHRDRWSGQFHLRLRPSRVLWEASRHALFFELLDHDIQFDSSLRGVLASIGIAAVNGLFGKNYILQKTIAALEGNQVQFELDHLNPKFQPLLEAFTLHQIECVENALQVRFSMHPRQVLRSCGHLAMSWLTRQTDP